MFDKDLGRIDQTISDSLEVGRLPSMPITAKHRSGTRKLRLLVTTTTLPRFESDPEPRFVIDLARSMADRFDITVLAPSYPGAMLREMMFGVEVVRYRYAPLQSWERLAYPGGIMSRLRAEPIHWLLVPALIAGQALALRRLMRTRRFDLIHAHWILPQGLLAATLPRRLRVPFVTTAHGGDVYTLGSGPLKPLLRFVLRRAAAVTAVSNELYQTLRSIGDSARDSIHRIPMGVDSRHFAQIAAKAERPDDMPKQGPVILFVGRLVEKKGVHVLIDALAKGQPELDAAHVVVVGDGPMKPDLIAHAAARGIADRVHFLGARAHDRLPAYLASADVFALPSVHAADGDKDGLPVTLMEAAACGIPVVASDIGGVSEFLAHGHNGLLVPPGDAAALASGLSKILSSPAVREAFAASALVAAQAFDWRLIGERYATVLAAALGGTPVHPVPAVPPGTSGQAGAGALRDADIP